MNTFAIRSLTSGEIDDSLLQGDGTMWSHAATLGTFFRKGAFTIDRAKIDSFIRNFTDGYSQKVPMDYEHGTIQESFGQPVPKAGDVLELKGVYSVDDFTGALGDAAKKLAEKARRELGDNRNYGLWIRWRPTARALELVRQGEYSELSICFVEDRENIRTGAKQGPTLLSIALTNTPALDEMLPVAASRQFGRASRESECDEALSILADSLRRSDAEIRNLIAHDSSLGYKESLRKARALQLNRSYHPPRLQ